MDSRIFSAVYSLLRQAASLLIYQAVLDDEVGQAFLELLHAILRAERNVAAEHLDAFYAYGRWFRTLAERNQSWQDHLLTRLVYDDNPFTRQVQSIDLSELPPALVSAVRQDLSVVQELYECSPQKLSHWLKVAAQLAGEPVVWQREADQPHLKGIRFVLEASKSWADGLEPLATYYRQHGTGLFAQYRAFRWQHEKLVGIAYPDPVRVADLAGYEAQRDTLIRNTEFLLQGYPAQNVLLYGSRGSGKSSLIKGLLNELGDRGLRLVEVAKSDLHDLPLIIELLRGLPQKFILFVDDLSFEEDEDSFKALKVVLEGSLTARPQNVVVYATSNRRHLVREFFSDRPRPRDSEEIHAWDTVQEKLSFSDRFGLTLTFEPADQPTYLRMVHHLARQAGLPLSDPDLDFQALQWATRHNGRSGRTARQFIDFLRADLALAGKTDG